MPRRYGDDSDTVVVPGKDIGLTLQLKKLPAAVECEEFEPELKPLTWSDGESDKAFILQGGWITPDWEGEYPFPLIAAVKGQWPITTTFEWTASWESSTPGDDNAPPHIQKYLNAIAVSPAVMSEYGEIIDDGVLTLTVKVKLPKKTVTLNPITMTVITSDC